LLVVVVFIENNNNKKKTDKLTIRRKKIIKLQDPQTPYQPITIHHLQSQLLPLVLPQDFSLKRK
jgi:hypothetical protein